MTKRAYPETPDRVICLACGAEFSPTRAQWLAHVKKDTGPFCDKPCWHAWQGRNKEANKAKEIAYKKTPEYLAKQREYRRKRAELNSKPATEKPKSVGLGPSAPLCKTRMCPGVAAHGGLPRIVCKHPAGDSYRCKSCTKEHKRRHWAEMADEEV